jgi:hypothetical protein
MRDTATTTDVKIARTILIVAGAVLIAFWIVWALFVFLVARFAGS